MPPIARSEAMRRLTHASVGALSLLLLWIPWPAVLICCVGGILMNMFLLPRIAPRIFRPDEGKFAGVRAYPMAVLLLVILFPLRTAAGAWAILAIGDSMAALIGRSMGRNKLPWNPDKSWQGFAAFVCFGTCAGAIAYSIVEAAEPRTFGIFGEEYLHILGQRPWLATLNAHLAIWGTESDYTIRASSGGLGAPAVWLAAGAAASAAALAETIRVKLDDNFRTALAAGAVLLYCDPLTKAIQSII
ncbi:MAG: hypothetical protein HY286_05205 [Planctomycetes bacterium]|nr:hypothetical protein [Planctomycetota bacterium]